MEETYQKKERSSRGNPDFSRQNGSVNGESIYPMFSELTTDEDLWRNYAETHSVDIRNHFIKKYLGLVKNAAKRIHEQRHLPIYTDPEDLTSAGLFGLMDAIDNFDLDNREGIRFEGYCIGRVRGEILSYLRDTDWVPRLIRTREKIMYKARQSLEKLLGRSPSEPEIQQALNMDDSEYKKIQKDGTTAKIESLNAKVYDKDLGTVEFGKTRKDPKQEDPVSNVEKKSFWSYLTKRFSRAERMLITLYYRENLTMREIGEALGLHESGATHMHSNILKRLKSQMKEAYNGNTREVYYELLA